MKGIFIACPNANCKRPLLTEAYLAPRTVFKMVCAFCGTRTKLETDGARLKIIVIHKPTRNFELTDDDDGDIVMLNV